MTGSYFCNQTIQNFQKLCCGINDLRVLITLHQKQFELYPKSKQIY